MDGDVRRIASWLNTNWRVTVPDDWIEACLEWIQEETQVHHSYDHDHGRTCLINGQWGLMGINNLPLEILMWINGD